MKTKNTAIVFGGWSTNIGNSFFQLGAKYVLEKAFPHHNILLIQDQPGYYNVKRGTPKNAFIPLENMRIDYLVILGPFLRPEIGKIWGSTFEKILNDNVKIIILSAGMMDYGDKTVRTAREWLSKIKPYILTTRDEETYQNFSDFAKYSYNGIDLAFYVPDFYTPNDLKIDRCLVLNFDKTPEPKITISRNKKDISSADKIFTFDDKLWGLKFPSFLTWLSTRSKIISVLGPLLDIRRDFPEKIDKMKIIRTDHRFNPIIFSKLYKKPMSFCSDIPWGYLDIYSQASLLLSNRVHACVAALAHGNPAMLFSKTPRARLLERVGAKDITKKPVKVSQKKLKKEKKELIAFLKNIPL